MYLTGSDYVGLPSKGKVDRFKAKPFHETSSNNWCSELQKRSNSVRLPSKSEKVSAELMASCQCVVWFLHSISLKYCACHDSRPSEARSYDEVLDLSRKIIFANLHPGRKICIIWFSKKQPLAATCPCLQVAAGGCKWLLVGASGGCGCKWWLWLQVAAGSCKWL